MTSTVKRIFIVAGEHSGDALGAALITALRDHQSGLTFEFAGVGGGEMARAGIASLFPLDDVAVMGAAILPALPRIVRRVYQAVDAAIAFKPDLLVIIDSPEFSHPIAKRVRKRAPHIKIANYVSPSVWAWRPGRAKRMRVYIDHVLALLPFEPDAHARLGGPPCTYVGHPLVEKLPEIARADGEALRRSLGLTAAANVLLVLPGSRRSEVSQLLNPFQQTAARVAAEVKDLVVMIPAVVHLKAGIEATTEDWSVPTHVIDGAEHKYAAMKLARAALAASGTVTLELALAETPTVVAYKVDRFMKNLRFLLKVPSVVLANLVLGKNVYPEFLQERCTPELMSAALVPLLHDTPERRAQIKALSETASRMGIPQGTPSAAAASVIVSMLDQVQR
jgi:lipid-A-disaccharide synthase